jgi:hypothetical protein
LSIVLILGALGAYVYWDVKGLELAPGDEVVLMINNIGGRSGEPVPVRPPGRQDSLELETGAKGKISSIFRNGDPPFAYVVLNDSSSTVEVELKYVHKSQ